MSVGEQVEVYKSGYVVSQLLARLGFAVPDAIESLGEPGAYYVELSRENIADIDADVLIWFNPDGDAEPAKTLLLRDRLKAHAEGREVFAGKVLAGAFSFSSPLSLAYVLDTLVPEIELAADGKPETVVPSAAEAGLTQ